MTRIGNPRDGSSHDSPTILKARDTPAINSEQLDTHHADSGCCELGTYESESKYIAPGVIIEMLCDHHE